VLPPRPTKACVGWAGLALCAAMGWALATAPPANAQVRRITVDTVASSEGAFGAKPIPLVNADDDYRTVLAKAESFIHERSYQKAIEYLQVLIDRADASGVIPDPDGRRYVSVRRKAVELIGRLGPEGLKEYRKRYDPQAEELYDRGLATGDTSLLRRVVDSRLHTSFGGRALEALGSLYFDRGQFVQAARYWSRALALGAADDREPLILTKLAAAYHLSGDAARTDQVARTLRKEYPRAKGILGGSERTLYDFVAEVRKITPDLSGARREFREYWPGMGGVADGVGLMEESDVVLAARWRHPAGPEDAELSGKLAIADDSVNPFGPTNVRFVPRLKNGHVEAHPTAARSGSVRPGRFVVPAMLHPVIVNDTVYYRRSDAVVACDLVTGQERWRSIALPIFRSLRSGSGARYIYSGYPYGAEVGDDGRYTLTVGAGKIFAVANFRPNIYIRSGRVPPSADKKDLADSSELVALSVSAQLKQVWRVGNQEQGDEVVANGKYLCAPTFCEDRLYALVSYIDNYHLVCLDADTGSLIWRSGVAEAPAIPQRSGYPTASFLHRGSPPAVCDGRVFVTTNAGVVASFDADTGRIVWAYQYPSRYDRYASSGGFARRSSGTVAVGYPMNPLIVTGGRVICLPADSDKVLVLSSEDGQMLQATDRGGCLDLSAIDSGRFVLSGPGLKVLSVPDGKVLFEAALSEVSGRPAVTPEAVLACGKAKLLRLDLRKFALTSTHLTEAGGDGAGLLGNLVSVRDELIAANAAGICSYMSYEQARKKLTQRLQTAGLSERVRLLFRRGQFAFNARRFSHALTDFLEVEGLGEQFGDAGINEAALRSEIYRTYVALGNHAEKDPGEMLGLFQKAESYVKTDLEKAHMQLRMAKYHDGMARRLAEQAKRNEADGDIATAVELKEKMLLEAAAAVTRAQEIGERYGQEELVDVVIGAGAPLRFSSETERAAGKNIARAFIDDVIHRFGREPYTPLDEQARGALVQARTQTDPDAMVALAERWPNSLWADDARFAAAEIYYRMATGREGEESDDLLGRAVRQLNLVTSESPEGRMRILAHVGLATIYSVGGRRMIAADHCQQAKELATDVQGVFQDLEVEFADKRGMLGEVIEDIQARQPGSPRTRLPYFAMIQAPLHKAFGFSEDVIYIVRDQESRPIRLGQRVLALRGNRLVLVNTSARDADSAIAWVGLTGFDSEKLRSYSYPSPGMRVVGGVSSDGEVLALADRTSLRGFDVRTAKARWTRTMAEIGIGSFAYMGVGDGVLVAVDNAGRVACVDLGTGEKRWAGRLTGAGRSNPSGPPRIAAGRAVLRHNNMRALACFDLESGKILARWQASREAYACFAENGLLVTMVDGKVSVYDPTQMNKPVWSQSFAGGSYPMILGASRDYIAFSASTSSDRIDILSLGDGRKVAQLSVRQGGAGMAVPVDAEFDGEDLYVVCSVQNPGRRKNYYGRMTRTRGLTVEKWTLGTRPRRAWRLAAEENPGISLHTLPLVLGKDHVVVTVKSRNTNGPAEALILDARTGRTVQKFALAGKVKDPTKFQRRFNVLGPPVMTNGRLCVETTEGIMIYGK